MKIIDVLLEMDESIFDFWGTGSRFSSGKISGDFDFFTEDTKEVLSFLKDLGFCVSGEGYNDSVVSMVVEHKAGVHVQLTVDVELKKKARNFIAESGLEYFMRKMDRRRMWNMIIKGLQSQMNKDMPKV